MVEAKKKIIEYIKTGRISKEDGHLALRLFLAYQKKGQNVSVEKIIASKGFWKDSGVAPQATTKQSAVEKTNPTVSKKAEKTKKTTRKMVVSDLSEEESALANEAARKLASNMANNDDQASPVVLIILLLILIVGGGLAYYFVSQEGPASEKDDRPLYKRSWEEKNNR